MTAFSEEEAGYMRRAIGLAQSVRHRARPNPAVGCVLVRNGKIVAEGATAPPGGPHAERVALAAAGAAARAATAFVTLEPCAHHGRTPPCAQALIDAGVAEVVIAVRDPNPAVDGRGEQALAAAGVGVRRGLLAAEAERLIAGFARRVLGGRPRLLLKTASSLDGATAMAGGESQWITGAEARAEVQALRARAGAVLTGRGTVVADDPALTVRDPRFADMAAPPLRVVVDSALRSPPGRTLFRDGIPTLVYTCTDPAGRTLGDAEIVRVAAADGQVALDAVLDDLGGRGVNDVLAEAGPTLAGALLAAGLVDELRMFVAPCLLGSETQRLFATPALTRLAQRIELDIVGWRRVGADWCIEARPGEPRPPADIE
ncbi:MAG: bifunctional diaminohydroxyphosphoribosylaminopyrimidine deaminase/5-amino-6-(5-phosphoribosylamino)uracil reductase RibD [Pseudomonadota bacterium]